MILVISTESDGHVGIVGREFATLGAPWVRFDTECFPQQVQLEIEFAQGAFHGTLHFYDNNMTVDFSEITSVWYRRPESPKIHADVTDPEARQIAEAECRSALRGLWAALHDRFWMSWPMNIRRADQKLLQLRLAAELGFCIPPTLITQNPDHARSFHRKITGAVAVKTLSGIFIEGPPHRAVYTNLLKDEHLAVLDNVVVCPTLFQRYIDKAVELRVIVVWDTVFAVEMQTQADPRAMIDWRRGSPVSVPHVPTKLPSVLEERCLRLARRLGLTFGAIDLIRTPAEEYVFLEINPNGQWAWLEGLTGLPIARKIAEVLSNPPDSPKNF